MTSHHRNMYLIFVLVITVAVIILSRQIILAENIVIKPENVSLVSDGILPIPISASDPLLGNPGAQIIIVEFSDLGCKDCKKIHNTLTTFVSANPSKAKLIWKNFPQEHIFTSNAFVAHQAAICAGKQKQFWPFVQKVFETNIKEANLQKIASDLKLNTESWATCTTDATTKKQLSDAIAEAKYLGIPTVPNIFINNKQINLTKDINLEQLLNSLIAP